LRDVLADSLAPHLDRLPAAAELLAAARDGAGGGRLAVRGLTGSARTLCAAWLFSRDRRTVALSHAARRAVRAGARTT
jgi:hypothetical protein